MNLVDLNLSVDSSPPPHDVCTFLREADRRIERFRSGHCLPGFVPSDYSRAYGVLRAVADGSFAPGNVLCEWGSGFGVVACLAAMLEFDACGIEIERELVDAAQLLADDFDLPVEFIHGSFIPEGSEDSLDSEEGFSWLSLEAGGAPAEMGIDPADFDVIFVYPWPDEEWAMAELFQRHARVGSLLATYHGGDDLRLRRKTAGRRR